VGNFIENYTNTGSSGIAIGLAHVRGASVIGNYVRNCGLAGVHIEDGSSDVKVYGNFITDCPGDGIQIISGIGRVVDHVSVSDNLVKRCATGTGRYGIMIGGVVGSQNITVDHNRVETCGRLDGRTVGISTGWKPVNVVVSNNTVVDLVGAEVTGIELAGNESAFGNRVCWKALGSDASSLTCTG
jgi:hypothetical protein